MKKRQKMKENDKPGFQAYFVLEMLYQITLEFGFFIFSNLLVDLVQKSYPFELNTQGFPGKTSEKRSENERK